MSEGEVGEERGNPSFPRAKWMLALLLVVLRRFLKQVRRRRRRRRKRAPGNVRRGVVGAYAVDYMHRTSLLCNKWSLSLFLIQGDNPG